MQKKQMDKAATDIMECERLYLKALDELLSVSFMMMLMDWEMMDVWG